MADERYANAMERRVTARLRTTRASRILAADPTVAGLMDRDASSIIGQPLVGLIPMAAQSEFRSRLALLPDEGRIADWAFDVLTPGGEPVRVVAEVVVTPSADTDDTNEANLDWQLVGDRAQQEARPSPDVARAEIAAQLGHELNQPLSAITTYARGALLRARAGTLTPEDLERVLSIIVAEAMRVADQIRRIGAPEEERKR